MGKVAYLKPCTLNWFSYVEEIYPQNKILKGSMLMSLIFTLMGSLSILYLLFGMFCTKLVSSNIYFLNMHFKNLK
jgi:hypothetical protein